MKNQVLVFLFSFVLLLCILCRTWLGPGLYLYLFLAMDSVFLCQNSKIKKSKNQVTTYPPFWPYRCLSNHHQLNVNQNPTICNPETEIKTNHLSFNKKASISGRNWDAIHDTFVLEKSLLV